MTVRAKSSPCISTASFPSCASPRPFLQHSELAPAQRRHACPLLHGRLPPRWQSEKEKASCSAAWPLLSHRRALRSARAATFVCPHRPCQSTSKRARSRRGGRASLAWLEQKKNSIRSLRPTSLGLSLAVLDLSFGSAAGAPFSVFSLRSLRFANIALNLCGALLAAVDWR